MGLKLNHVGKSGHCCRQFPVMPASILSHDNTSFINRAKDKHSSAQFAQTPTKTYSVATLPVSFVGEYHNRTHPLFTKLRVRFVVLMGGIELHFCSQTSVISLSMMTLDHAVYLTLRPKWPPFSRRHFQMHFLEWKYMNFDSNFAEICS